MRLQPGDVREVARCRLTVGPGRWAYADAHRAAVDAAFAAAQRRNPGYFNGAVQMLVDHDLDGDTFTGSFVTSDFASFLYWFERDAPDRSVRDCFGSAILTAADGALIMGVQRAGNLNAGRAYFPGGFIDKADVDADGVIDIDGSVARELAEETGLDPATLARRPGYVLSAMSAAISIGIVYRASQSAEALRAQIVANLAADREAELAEILIVRSPADLAGRATAAYVPVLIQALLAA